MQLQQCKFIRIQALGSGALLFVASGVWQTKVKSQPLASAEAPGFRTSKVSMCNLVCVEYRGSLRGSFTVAVVLLSQAVHAKRVDSNLLAEFVPCPMLLLP